MKKIQFISLFPNMFPAVCDTSMLRKAQSLGAVEFRYIDLRKYGIGPRHAVDDIPYGGGDGMVLRPEPLFAAVEAAKEDDPEAVVYMMTPRGGLFTQSQAQLIAGDSKGMILICGRYEGYDERIMSIVDVPVRIGDYVLTGGELPAMVLVDAVVRLLPGVLGGETSAELESFADGLTREHPHYTRPENFRGMSVPPVLLSGHHAEIQAWRDEHSIPGENRSSK